MAKQRVTLELDDETLSGLAVLGQPTEVLVQLAHSAADRVRRPDHQHRSHTDESLRLERHKVDTLDERHEADAAKSDDVRWSEHQGVDRAKLSAQVDADAMLARRRAERRHDRASSLTAERAATDTDLSGERAQVDTLLRDQREANEQMVRATIRAQELADEIAADKERAEERERALRAVAEIRELFIGILGHDLRNPLGSIVMAAATLLRRGHLDEQDAEHASRIIRSSQRITRMITQLLDLTRARLGGGLPIDPKPADLGEVCQNVVGEFEATIHLEQEGDLTGVWDSDRLTQALSNLTGNAIEHAEPGTVVIVKAHADGDEVVVDVINQGKPIPPDVLPFIFEPFRRAKQREKSATGNLGLGLFIARQIALSHGGTLDTHSAAGTTAFVMRLPRTPLTRTSVTEEG